jgi:hypothetical protein
VGLEELSTLSYSVPLLHMPLGLGIATSEICVDIISSKYHLFLWANADKLNVDKTVSVPCGT